MRLFEGLAQYLRGSGTDSLFGLMGDGNLFLVDHFARLEGARFVNVAHESTAVLAALGYARVSGSVGVATVTHGPALTNTVTALIEGARARLPVVLVAGDTAAIDESNLQNVPQRAIAEAAEAGFVQVRAPHTWLHDVSRAFREAVVQRRPVILNVPVDLMWSDVPEEFSPWAVNRIIVEPDDDDLDAALGAIVAARRPIVLAGRGATSMGARGALLALAARIGAPVATSIGAKDLFAGEEADLGVFGGLSVGDAVAAIAESDCVVAFGASLNGFTTEHDTLLMGKTIVVCDIDPGRIRSDLADSYLVMGEAEIVARTMTERIEQAGVTASGFRDRYRHGVAHGVPLADDAAFDIRNVLALLDALLPPDHVLVTDGGRFLPLSWKALHVEHPRKLVPTIHFGSIGLGMGHAIGAAVAAVDSPVTLITGDGGHMLGGYTEISSAVRAGIDLTVVVLNDGGYGAEFVQFTAKGMDPSLALNSWPDLARAAIAAGADAETVTSLPGLRAAMQAARRSSVRLLDVRLDPATIPDEIH